MALVNEETKKCPVEGCSAEIKEIRVFGVQINITLARGKFYIFETIQNRDMEIDCTEGHSTDIDEAFVSEELRDWVKNEAKEIQGYHGG